MAYSRRVCVFIEMGKNVFESKNYSARKNTRKIVIFVLYHPIVFVEYRFQCERDIQSSNLLL